jgi:hypothetical protein
MKKIIILLLILLSNSLFAQNYNDFAHEIFFDRFPGARIEAMGRILSLNFDPYFVSQSNPANLVNTTGASVFYSNSSPYYTLKEAVYNYAGFSYNNPRYGGFAFNYLKFNTGMSLNIRGAAEPAMNLYTLTYANEIADWFDFGMNANLFVYEPGGDNTFTATFFELGLSRSLSVVQNAELKDKITLGTQIKNIFNQSFSTVDEAYSDPFPSVVRIGLSNSVEYTDTEVYGDSYLIGFALGLEYQNVLNSRYRTAYKAGSEFSFFDIIFLRAGYYYETKIDYGFNSTDKLEDFTYGFGLKLTFERYFKNNFPLVLLFDLVSLEQPSYTTTHNSSGNFTTFTLIAGYELK